MRAMGCDSATEHTGNEGKKVMRIVLIGIAHWHTPFHSDPALRMKDATIVGVSDPDAERAAPLAAPGSSAPSHGLLRWHTSSVEP
jgi:predicted dehydrogenase